jgi:tricorn protease interacting factor F2/3
VLEYDVALEIDFPANSFRGTVEISGLDGTGPVELDSVDLAIEGVRAAGLSVPFELNQKTNKLVIRPATGDLETVRIEFSGRAAEGVQTGFYVSRIGSLKALTTQMEPESCRRLLPCLDRPDRKGVFRLQVTTQKDLVVISNMPSETLALPDDRTRWTFAATPPMSSYLLYLGIGPFEETVDDQGPIRVVVAGVPGKRSQAERTARIARTILRGFVDYFDVPYPLPKLHLVAFADFWAGMENWGAISGSEDMYLLDENASPVNLQFGDEVIAHEIAHQWFGDLVTLRTWDDLWLNEAFATFAVPIVQERTHLRRDPWAEFLMRTHRGDYADSLWSAHPVKPDTYEAAEIMANADVITYQKGARLIRMIESFLGRDEFRDGITEYLRDHQYGNARSDDLWETLEEESRSPVSKVMRSWIERPGHPRITVRQIGPDVELTQSRFTFVPGDRSEPPWSIPLAWTQGEARGSMIFDFERATLQGVDASTLCIDPGRAGFFRLLWSPELRTRVLADLSSLPTLDRWAIFHDGFAFLLSGDYSLDDYLTVLRAASNETDRLTVEEVARSLDLLYPVLWDHPQFHESAREFCRTQTARLSEHARPGEPEGWDVVRDWVFWLGAHIDGDYARSLASRFETVDREPPCTHQAIASAFAREGAPGAEDRLLARARGSDANAAVLASFALGEIQDPGRMVRVLDEALPSIPMASFFVYLLPMAARNPGARPALWDWLARNLRGMERRAIGSPMLSVCLERSLPFVGIGRSAVVTEYFERERFPEAHPGIRRGLEVLEAHERLRKRIEGKGRP